MSRNKDTHWLNVAEAVAQMSLCDSRKVGSVLLSKEGRVASTGYNGPPSGLKHSEEGCSKWCKRQSARAEGVSGFYGLLCPSVHSEVNALMFADRSKYESGTLYVTSICCEDCSKIVANSGVSRVVVALKDEDIDRDFDSTVRFMRSCGLEVDVVNMCKENKLKGEYKIAKICDIIGMDVVRLKDQR